MEDLVIIGGGPAGIMAAITASGNNKKVVLIDKNPSLGKKLSLRETVNVTLRTPI